jgi:hypothetical protein
MRSRLLRGIAASALALAVSLPGAASPARAASDPSVSDQLFDAASAGWRIYRAGTVTPDDFIDFARLLTVALAGMQDAVIGQIDGHEAATVLAHARAVGREMANLELILQNEVLLWRLAMDLNGYAANAYEKYQSVASDSKKAKDQIGLAAHVIFPATLTVRKEVRAFEGLAEIEADYQRLNRWIVNELEPVCTQVPGELDPHPLYYEVDHECTAANGKKVTAKDYKVGDRWVHGPVNVDALKLEAAAESSWATAKKLLENQPGNP